MKKPLLITLQVVFFAIIALMGILYIMNKTPVEDLGDYEKTEMAKPNRSKSIVDQFFSTDSRDSSDDDVSLTGGSGRYDEVRIGKSMDEE